MNIRSSLSVAAALLGLGATSGLLHAEVKMPAIFGDHMVLQEGAKLPLWGTADPGEAVTVKVGDRTGTATADASGKWRVDLAAMPASSKPVTVTVTGKNTLTFSDVLVGDVWLCTGQSNMGVPVKIDRGADADSKTNEPEIRCFMTPLATALEPKDDIGAAKGPYGKWIVCTPDTFGGPGGWSSFSAVGFYFGLDIHKATGHPVGLLGSYVGGTPAQAWTSLSGLKKEPSLQHYVDAYNANVAAFPKASAEYPGKMEKFKTDLVAWNKAYGMPYARQVVAWDALKKQNDAANQTSPPRPEPAQKPPASPTSPEGGTNGPANLYNGMIAPLIPYAVKGAIWYQGEGNAGASYEYRTLFPTMISDWREKWGQGNFPFLWVQLANFNVFHNPIQSWPYLREAQAMTLKLPETGMATAVDVGDPNNIHPRDKYDVGHRLALAARHLVYGEKLVYSGPVYDSLKVKGGKAHVTFTHEGGGLVIAQAPWAPPGVTKPSTDKLVGFEIAGADKNFVPADAKIAGDDVVVSSPQVAEPVAVRYDWANAPVGNLYNKDGLPAFPFRTDDWVDARAMGMAQAAAKK